jgi:hypothetical protein
MASVLMMNILIKRIGRKKAEEAVAIARKELKEELTKHKKNKRKGKR